MSIQSCNASLLLRSDGLVAVAEDQIDASPVTLKLVSGAQLRLLLGESLGLSFLDLKLQLLVAVDLELL